MSNLEEALKALAPKPKPQGCKTCMWLAGQSETVQNYVHDWFLEDHSTKQLYEVLHDHGYPLGIGALKCHGEHIRSGSQ